MTLWLRRDHADQMARHALADAPLEACGVLLGSDERVTRVVPIANIAADPWHYFRLDDRALAACLLQSERAGETLIGFYHSHPEGAPTPSRTDIAQSAYPDAAYLILGTHHGEATLAGWRIRPGAVERLDLHVSDDPPPASDPTTTAGHAAILVSAGIAFALFITTALALLPPAPPIP